MNRLRALAVGIGLLVAVLAVPATPAYAVDTYAERQCSSGGFTGYIRVHYSYTPGSGQSTVRYYSYRINKGTNRGGNEADVHVRDNGIMPARSYSTYSGIQDNSYHVLADPPNYNRANSEYFSFTFVFDKSLSSDPACNGSIRYSTY